MTEPPAAALTREAIEAAFVRLRDDPVQPRGVALSRPEYDALAAMFEEDDGGG